MNEKMNPKIVEKWIASTLEDAKYFDIPGKKISFHLLFIKD